MQPSSARLGESRVSVDQTVNPGRPTLSGVKALLLALGICVPFGIAQQAIDTVGSETEGSAQPTSAPNTTETPKKKKKKPIVQPGDGDASGGEPNIVNCWCEGGDDGNGPAGCEDSCTDACCEGVYGPNSEAEDN